jgi:hypothetical protein
MLAASIFRLVFTQGPLVTSSIRRGTRVVVVLLLLLSMATHCSRSPPF